MPQQSRIHIVRHKCMPTIKAVVVRSKKKYTGYVRVIKRVRDMIYIPMRDNTSFSVRTFSVRTFIHSSKTIASIHFKKLSLTLLNCSAKYSNRPNTQSIKHNNKLFSSVLIDLTISLVACIIATINEPKHIEPNDVVILL
jgi:hypothetical protein